jgi:hypothetical protein
MNQATNLNSDLCKYSGLDPFTLCAPSKDENPKNEPEAKAFLPKSRSVQKVIF